MSSASASSASQIVSADLVRPVCVNCFSSLDQNDTLAYDADLVGNELIPLEIQSDTDAGEPPVTPPIAYSVDPLHAYIAGVKQPECLFAPDIAPRCSPLLDSSEDPMPAARTDQDPEALDSKVQERHVDDAYEDFGPAIGTSQHPEVFGSNGVPGAMPPSEFIEESQAAAETHQRPEVHSPKSASSGMCTGTDFSVINFQDRCPDNMCLVS